MIDLCTYLFVSFPLDNMMQSAPVVSAPAQVPMNQDHGMPPAGPPVPVQSAPPANPSQMPQQQQQSMVPQQHLQQAPIASYPQPPSNSKQSLPHLAYKLCTNVLLFFSR